LAFSLPTKAWPAAFGNLTVLRQALAVAQHHDAVAGTERQAVADDYAKHLNTGMNLTSNFVVEPAIAAALALNPGQTAPLLFTTEHQAIQALNQGKIAVLVITNTLQWKRTEYIRLSVPTTSLGVFAVTNSSTAPIAVPIQISSTYQPQNYTLWIQATVEPFSITTYFVLASNSTQFHQFQPTDTLQGALENEYLSVHSPSFHY